MKKTEGARAGLARWAADASRRVWRLDRPEVLPGVTLPARPGVLAAVAFLLVGLCLILACWGARADPAGFDLRRDTTSVKVDNKVTAEEPPLLPRSVLEAPRPLPVAQAPPTRPAPAVATSGFPEIPLPPPPAADRGFPGLPALPNPAPAGVKEPAPVLPLFPAVPEPLRPPPTVIQPVAYLMRPEPAGERHWQAYRFLGETPMMRTFYLLGLQTLLASSLTLPAFPALAGPPDIQDLIAKQQKEAAAARPDPAREDAVVEQLKDLKEQLLKELRGIKESLTALEKQLPKANGDMVAELRAQSVKKEMNDLRTDMEQLKKDVKDMRSRMTAPAPETRALYPPAGAPAAQVVLTNEFPGVMSVLVNGRSYQLAQGETRVVEVPAGAFTYEVLSSDFGVVQPRVNRTVAANKTFPITIHVR